MIIQSDAALSTREGAVISSNVMFFDGLRIEADFMSDPRWDRVLPIFEEAQIFICRQMKPLLDSFPKPSLMLDVGVGNGVFAIWAAKCGHKVIGVDINPRALKAARQNAINNGIEVCDKPEELKHGGICLMLKRFDEQFVSDKIFSEKFDCAFLNPPYNPTCPGITPALHAESGKDGQRCFREQIAAVPAVLKEDGTCVGIQMTIKDNLGIQAFREIKKAFGENCSVNYAHILDREYFPVREFLERQYEAYLQVDSAKVSRADVRSYINEVSAGSPEFAFIYYSISKHKHSQGKFEPTRESRIFAPSRNWNDRIELHRQIVNNTAFPEFTI